MPHYCPGGMGTAGIDWYINLPSHFWPGSQVSVPALRNHKLSNIAAVWTLLPAPTLRSEKKSCAVAFSSAADRTKSLLDRARCQIRCWNLPCLNKESTISWFLSGWDGDLYSRSKAIMVDWCHRGILNSSNWLAQLGQHAGKISHSSNSCFDCTQMTVFTENV